MQSNLEGFFGIRRLLEPEPVLVVNSDDSRKNLMELLSGSKRSHPQVVIDDDEEEDEVKSYPVVLRISPEKLGNFRNSRVNPRDLFAMASQVRRKFLVTMKVSPEKLRTLRDRAIDLETEQEVIEIKEQPFKSRIRASDVLMNFKNRQSTKKVKPIDDDLEMSDSPFMNLGREEAQLAKLMKQKGVNTIMEPPVLSRDQFHVFEKNQMLHRTLDFPSRKPIPDLDLSDSRFGPILMEQSETASRYDISYVEMSNEEINTKIQELILEQNGNSRLIELLALMDDEVFQKNKREKSMLLCNLFKPRNHHSLLIPSNRIKSLLSWFKDSFKNLPKKKPNRGHLFKKSELESEFDSFIVDFSTEDVQKDQQLPVIIITGDPGVGKTALIETILSDLNAYVYKLDSSNLDKREVKEMAIHQKYDLNHIMQDSCILFDEIPEDEEAFFTILRHLLIITRKPVVLTLSKEEARKLPHWLSQVESFEFKRVNETLMISYLKIISLILKFDIENLVLKEMIIECDFDLRKCLNDLQLLMSAYLEYKDGLIRITRKERITIDRYENITSLRELEHRHNLESLQLEKTDDETELARLQKQHKTKIFNKAVKYYNSKNYKYSKRQFSMPKHFEFSSSHYNTLTKSNWNLFRLEFYEFLLQTSRVESFREIHDRIFQDNPLDLLE